MQPKIFMIHIVMHMSYGFILLYHEKILKKWMMFFMAKEKPCIDYTGMHETPTLWDVELTKKILTKSFQKQSKSEIFKAFFHIRSVLLVNPSFTIKTSKLFEDLKFIKNFHLNSSEREISLQKIISSSAL